MDEFNIRPVLTPVTLYAVTAVTSTACSGIVLSCYLFAVSYICNTSAMMEQKRDARQTSRLDTTPTQSFHHRVQGSVQSNAEKIRIRFIFTLRRVCNNLGYRYYISFQGATPTCLYPLQFRGGLGRNPTLDQLDDPQRQRAHRDDDRNFPSELHRNDK